MKTKNVDSRYENQLSQNIEKINPKELIKEALSTIDKKEENSKEINYYQKISEQLNRIKIKALKNYLQSIGHKKLEELKEGIGEEMDKYNKNLFSLLIKSNTDLKEANKNILNLKNKLIDSENKIHILQNHKNELLKKLKNLESHLVNLQKEYSTLLNEKKFFDDIKNIYPGLTLKEMILEIQMSKNASLSMLESYTDKSKELLDIKKEQIDSKSLYQKKINSLTEELHQLSLTQKEEKEKFQNQIAELTNKIELYETRIKENDYLRNSLYYIYNLLFEKMDLLKDIKINDKFRKAVNEKDFTPNILYEPELVAYIELIIKRMNNFSYDKLFRECVGYLNAIARNYFPKNINLRFKPVDIFREISNLIEQKIKIINEYKNSIKFKEIQIKNMQLEYNKLKEKNDRLENEYNSYKLLIEKSIKFSKYDINNINNHNQEKVYKTVSNTNFHNFNISSKNIKKKRKKGIYLKDYKFSFDIENYKSDNKAKEFSRNEKRQRALSFYKGNSIYLKFHNKNKSVKNMRQIAINNDINNSGSNILTYRIEKGENNKLKIENGNQNKINNLNAVNELIDETNRLFLYRTRMTSFQKNTKNMGLEENSIKKKEINQNLKEKILKENSTKAIEGKIIKKLDKLISSSKIK